MTSDPIERAMQAADVSVEPRQPFADDLLAQLLDQLAANQSDDGKEIDVSIAIAAPAGNQTQVSSVSPSRARMARTFRGRPSMTAHLATAALLLLTLVGGLYAAGVPGQFGLMRQTTPGVTNELIAQAQVDSMPEDYFNTFIGISRFTIMPGGLLESGPDKHFGDGLYLFAVEQGSVTILATGPIGLNPGEDGSGNVMPDGGEFTFNAGDKGVLWPGTVATWTNTNQEPGFVLIAAVGEATTSVEQVEQVDLVKSNTTDWPDAPATFSLRKYAFEPGASLSVDEFPGLMMLAVETGQIDVPWTIGQGNPDRIRTFDSRDGYIASNWTLATTGSLRNSGAETVIFYALLGDSIDPVSTPES